MMDDRQHLVALRSQLSNVCNMFALAMVMFDRTEEQDILRLAVSSSALWVRTARRARTGWTRPGCAARTVTAASSPR
jgi:hypothetical protein